MGSWQSQHGEMNAAAQVQDDRGWKYRPASLEESADIITAKKNGGGVEQIMHRRTEPGVAKRGQRREKSVQRRRNTLGLFIVQVRSAGNRKSRLELHCLLFTFTICTGRRISRTTCWRSEASGPLRSEMAGIKEEQHINSVYIYYILACLPYFY